MDNNVKQNETDVNVSNELAKNNDSKVNVIDIDKEITDGQNKCPKCGATDITLDVATGKLKCKFCRHLFDLRKIDNIENDIASLKGKTIGSGSANIIPDAKDVMTFKCTSCAAEVIIDTKDSVQARCHWCRNTLSINQQIPNGAIPDSVLPFNITKEIAKVAIDEYVKKKKFYALPKFLEEFKAENVMGVYLPYLIVDVNSKASLKGEGEIETDRRTVKRGDSYETYYDANVFAVQRDFDLMIHDLTVESNTDKLNYKDKSKTTNIINAIMPFDTENAVKWDANFLKGFSSEKRNMDVDVVNVLVKSQVNDIARSAAKKFIGEYDRGVSWKSEHVDIIGEQWISSYLPVWLYSYKEKDMLHYIAVNARTKEIVGSIPINMPKLIIISAIIELLLILFVFSLDFDSYVQYILLLGGPIYYTFTYKQYRNQDARHKYEHDTKIETANEIKVDDFITERKNLRSPQISNANDHMIKGQTLDELMKKEK